MLGEDPETGLQVTLRTGRFGPYVQLGPMRKGRREAEARQHPEGLGGRGPRSRGGAEAARAAARDRHPSGNGQADHRRHRPLRPFVEHAGKYANLDSVDEVFTVGANRADLAARREEERASRAASASVLKELGEHPTLGGPVTVRSGRYGPYVNHGKVNATLPRDDEAGGRDARAGGRASRRDAKAAGRAQEARSRRARRRHRAPQAEAAAPRPRRRRNRHRIAAQAEAEIAPELPTREAILAFIAEQSGKAGKREIARAFGVSGGQKIGLKRLLKEMADDGLIEGRRKHIHRPGDLPSVTVLAVEGIDDEGEPIGVPVEWDEEWGAAPRIVIAPEPKAARRQDTAPGIGDRVLARLTPDEETGGFTARVIKLLERQPQAALGIFRERDGEARIVPIDRRGDELTVSPDAAKGAQDGELVSVEVVKQRAATACPSARVVERLGDVSSEKAISLIALEEHGIPHVFPRAVLDAAEAAEPADMAHREDWTKLPLVTIDPPDARDHDDAVHAEPDPENPGGFLVTVAIADVAYYVRPGSALDREAEKRGNSVYFPGRVVPMLPERISNDLCSLREGEPRPALAVRMRFNADGRKLGHTFHRVMMRSAAKLSYEQAQAAIDGRPDEKTQPLLEPILKPLWAAYAALVARARPARAARDRPAGAQGDPERRRLGRPHRRAAAPRRAPADRRVHDPGERRRRRDAGGEDEARSSIASTTSRPSRSSTRCASSSARST